MLGVMFEPLPLEVLDEIPVFVERRADGIPERRQSTIAIIKGFEDWCDLEPRR
jgi:hypothetical protein